MKLYFWNLRLDVWRSSSDGKREQTRRCGDGRKLTNKPRSTSLLSFPLLSGTQTPGTHVDKPHAARFSTTSQLQPPSTSSAACPCAGKVLLFGRPSTNLVTPRPPSPHHLTHLKERSTKHSHRACARAHAQARMHSRPRISTCVELFDFLRDVGFTFAFSCTARKTYFVHGRALSHPHAVSSDSCHLKLKCYHKTRSCAISLLFDDFHEQVCTHFLTCNQKLL